MLSAIAGVACLGVSVYLFSNYRGEARLRDANQLGLDGRYAAAATVAGKITTGPAAARAQAIVAYADLADGNPAAAGAAFVRAVAQDPEDWTLRRDWAVTLRRLDNRMKARQEMQVALSLNPRLVLSSGFCTVSRRTGRRVVLC